VDRKDFFTAIKGTRKDQSQRSFRTLSGTGLYTGAWDTEAIIHLLKRTMFGAKKLDVDFFRTMTMSEAVDYLLEVTPAQSEPAPPVKTYNEAIDPGIPIGQTWVYTTQADSNAQRRNSLKNWWIGQMINQERNILEKLTLMWHNHFVVEMDAVGSGIFCYQNNAVLRKNALGDFKQFVKEITLDTGMLKYLNNYLNVNSAPDENYARELQELFTIGKGADNASAPFTEEDVKQAAKILTGWGLDNTNNVYLFRANRHDSSNKQFSAFYNNTLITGRTLEDGKLELDDLLNMIFSKEEVSLHICRKIYRWFVYYEIDAATELNVIAPLAQIFRNSGHEIKPVLAALLKSEHFFDAVNRGCMIKNPIDITVSLCREFNVAFPVSTDYVASYNMWEKLAVNCAAMQQEPGQPPNVAGWPAYYQPPQYQQLWINADTLPKRNIFSDTMITTGYSKSGVTIIIDTTVFAASMPAPSNPNSLVQDSLTYLLRIPLSQQSRDQLKTDMLLDGQANDIYWTTAWNTFVNNPADTANANSVKTKLKALYQYIMQLPEYQLS
jgi:uncharacterized protein (DUF1800 family)